MDSTRMTQHGNWIGNIKFKDVAIDLSQDNYLGTRDRSWGIRPVGAQDTQIVPPLKLPQYDWLWAPAKFLDQSSHLYFVDDESGYATHSHCVQQGTDHSVKLHELKKEIDNQTLKEKWIEDTELINSAKEKYSDLTKLGYKTDSGKDYYNFKK